MGHLLSRGDAGSFEMAGAIFGNLYQARYSELKKVVGAYADKKSDIEDVARSWHKTLKEHFEPLIRLASGCSDSQSLKSALASVEKGEEGAGLAAALTSSIKRDSSRAGAVHTALTYAALLEHLPVARAVGNVGVMGL